MPVCRLLCLLLLASPSMAAHSDPMLGFSAQGADAQGEWERKFRDGVSAANVRENMQRLTARPHHVGSPYDKDNAEWILIQVQGVGIRCKDRDLRRAVSDAEGARAGDAAALGIPRLAARARGAIGSDLGPDDRSNFPPTTPIRPMAM